MVKMSETCEQFGGNLQTINSQLEENAKSIDKVNSLLHQYKVWHFASDIIVIASLYLPINIPY